MAATPRTGLPSPLTVTRRDILAASVLGWPAHARSIMPIRGRRSDEKVRRVRDLSPGQGLHLGPARVLGDFNDTARRFRLHLTGPRSRDFSIKMVWAPERKRALFAGANHGSPHRLNDVWEFDLAEMAWHLLYPPDYPRSYGGLGDDPSDVLFDGQVLRTRRGGPAVIGHTWSGLTYDPVQRRALFMNTWPIDVEPLVRQVGGAPERRYMGPPLWQYVPGDGHWLPVFSEPPWPKAAVGAMLEYVPELGGAIWHLNNWQLSATWLFQPQQSRWALLADRSTDPGFAESAPGRELVGYHDAARRLVVSQHGTRTHHFDTRTLQWEVAATGTEPDGHDARTAFVLDEASGLGLLVDLAGGVLWSYKSDRRSWRLQRPAGDPMPRSRHSLAFVDQAQGVLVVLDDAEVWVYRPAAIH